jgi:hypothetical protein
MKSYYYLCHALISQSLLASFLCVKRPHLAREAEMMFAALCEQLGASGKQGIVRGTLSLHIWHGLDESFVLDCVVNATRGYPFTKFILLVAFSDEKVLKSSHKVHRRNLHRNNTAK